jgi:hypothetical protein
MRLKAALRDKPELLSDAIEANMQRVCSTSVGPSEGSETPRVPKARFWAENRSRIENCKDTVNWVWIIAGIHEALVARRFKEARARTALALAAGEQFAIDHGSWLLAWEVLLEEEEPPYASFAQHRVTASRAAHSRLIDPQWAEILQTKVKEEDDVADRQRRLAASHRGGGTFTRDGEAEGGGPTDGGKAPFRPRFRQQRDTGPNPKAPPAKP